MKDMFILPFDHRSTFVKKLEHVEGRNPTEEELNEIKDIKALIYEGFKKSLELGVPKENSAILVDEQFGSDILKSAKADGVITIMSMERSGQKELNFEYPDWQEHILKYEPDYAKVLLRYNPGDDPQLDERQLVRLKMLNEFLSTTKTKLLLEPLVPPTEEQLKAAGGQEAYDLKMRPKLMVQMMKEFQDFGVTPEIWKMEGVDTEDDCKALVEQAKAVDPAGEIVILGRGASKEKVNQWLTVGAKTSGVIGFAVGRTIFWDAVEGFKEGKKSREDAVGEIAKNYKEFVDLWQDERGKATGVCINCE